MNKRISFALSLALAIFFGFILLLPSLSPLYTKNLFFNFFDDLENIVYDVKMRTRGPIEGSNNVAIVVADEKSLSEIGRWPWPRKKFVKLTENLLEFDTKIIAYDLVFSEKEANQTEILSSKIKEFSQKHLKGNNSHLFEFLDEESFRNGSDRVFSELIGKNKGKLVLGYKFLETKMVPDSLKGSPKYSGSTLKSNITLLGEKGTKSLFPLFKTYDYVTKNIPEYSSSLSHEGFLNNESDSDSIYRKSHLVYKFKDKVFPSLALETYFLFKKGEGLGVRERRLEDLAIFGEISMGIAGQKESLKNDPWGAVYINYRGGKYSFPYYSISDILDDSKEIKAKFFDIPSGKIKEKLLAKEKAFKNKIILVGTSASLLSDIKPTPFNKTNYPGLEVQATVLDNLIKGDYLYKAPYQSEIQFVFMILLAVLLVFLILKLSYLFSFLAFSFLFSLIALSDYFIFFLGKGLVLDVSLIYLEMLFIYIFLLFYRYFIEEKDNRFLINTFKSYLSPDLIDAMYKAKELPSLGGETRFLTAFFSDVEGFSSFSEELSPKELVKWLNHYLTEMTTILKDEMGTLDKYEGDAIVGFFGAPIQYKNHAIRAATASLKMQIRLQAMREAARKNKGLLSEITRKTRARIGLNTGRMLTGNIGSKQRMNYTVMGHSVNLAARLESSAKQYGLFIQITKATKKEIENHFLVRAIDKIVVVGSKESVETFELLDFLGNKNKNLEKLVFLFEEGIKEYRLRNWQKAKSFFEKSAQYEKYRLSFDEGKTNPSKVYLKRCEDFIKNPPPSDWDGIFVLGSK